MSIRKNNNSSSDLHVTCQRLSKLPISSTVGATEYNITQYVHCQNAGFKTGRSGMYQGTCLMRAIIPATAEGYILGCRYTNSTDYDMYCRIEDVNGVKSVVWHYLGETIGSVPLDTNEQAHDYGFVNGYAVYDHAKVNPNQTLTTPPRKTTREFGFGCCSYYYGSGDSYDYCSDIYIIRCDCDLYESFTPTSYEMAWLCRFYPIYRGFYNAMRLITYSLQSVSDPSGSITEGPDLVEPYGIQKDDLVYITNGKYRDVLALMTDDGGVDARSGQAAADIDPPYTEIAGHSMAFDMRNTAYPGGVTPNPSTSLPDRRGRLLRGRKPKWDIWQDSVAHGFYIMDDNGVKTLMFNLFKKANGLDTEIELGWFHGYNTDPSTSHPPKILTSDGNMIIPFHNGKNYECNNSYVLFYKDGLTDDQQLWYVRNVGDFDFRVIAGNAIPWNIPKAELGEDYYIWGAGVDFTLFGETIGHSVEKESKYMCADNHTAEELALLKTKYRETGVGGTIVMNDIIAYVRNKLLEATGHTANGLIHLSLLRADDTIAMPELIADKNVSATGDFNPKKEITTTSNYRQFVSEHLESGKYLAYHSGIRGGAYYKNANYPADPAMLCLDVHECNSDGTALIDGTADYYAVVTLEQASSNEPNKCNDVIVGLVHGLQVPYESISPYVVGSREHVINDHHVNTFQAYEWYKGATNMGVTGFGDYTIAFALTTLDKKPNDTAISFNTSALAYSNVRFDIYSASKRPRLARFNGTYMSASDTIVMHNGTYSGGEAVFALRAVTQMCSTENTTNANIVAGMLMQKYIRTNNGFIHVNEGPDSGQAAPSFHKYITINRNGVYMAKFKFEDDYTYDPATRTYWGVSGYDVDSGSISDYICEVEFVELDNSFVDPNGNARTFAAYGKQWYYKLNIYSQRSEGHASYPQAGDVYDITFSDN